MPNTQRKRAPITIVDLLPLLHVQAPFLSDLPPEAALLHLAQVVGHDRDEVRLQRESESAIVQNGVFHAGHENDVNQVRIGEELIVSKDEGLRIFLQGFVFGFDVGKEILVVEKMGLYKCLLLEAVL